MTEETLKREVDARRLIYEALKEDDRCRNDDLWLILSVWRKQGVKFYIDYKDLNVIFTPETIRRNRAYIQNTLGELLPTSPAIMIKRKINEDKLRRFYATNPNLISGYEQIRYGGKIK